MSGNTDQSLASKLTAEAVIIKPNDSAAQKLINKALSNPKETIEYLKKICDLEELSKEPDNFMNYLYQKTLEALEAKEQE